MTYNWSDLTRKPYEPKGVYKGADVITQEDKWRQLGKQRRERMERLMKIGTLEAINECRKLRFYPLPKKTASLSFQARLHYLAGLLEADIGSVRDLPKQRLLQLQDSAREAGYEIVEIDPKTHVKL